MKFLNKLSVSTKIVLITSILSVLLLAIPLIFIVYNIEGQLVDQSLKSLEIETVSESSKVSSVITEIKDTVFSLANTPPIQGMFRALENDNFDEIENSFYDQWRSRLAVIFSAEINYVGIYDQIRYINEKGQEVVRVNNINSQAVIVKDDDLQNKADRPYFQEAVKFDAPELYSSGVELNREGQPPTIETPYKPVIRYAVPVFDSKGVNRGIIIINVLFDALKQRIDFLTDTSSDFYLVDDKGYFLSHSDPTKLWGSPVDLGTEEKIINLFPELEGRIFNRTSGVVVSKNKVYSFTKVYPNAQNSEYYWIVVRSISIDELFKPINRLVNFTFIIIFFTFILAFIAFLLGIKKLLRPLKIISEKAQKIGEGNFDLKINIDSQDEIGFLAQSLNLTATKLKNSYSLLEKKVKDKTKALQANVLELEKTKKAMLNILSDISEEKDKTKTLADDLEKFKLAVDNASDHIIITNPEGVVLYSNKAVEKITGYKPSEILGKKAPILWELPMPKEFQTKLWTTIKDKKKTFVGEIQNNRKNGLIYTAAVSISPVLNKEGQVRFFVGIERDITKEKQIDKAKTEFVSLASHQLRTPLTAINWYLEMLLSGDAGKINKKQQEFIDEVYKGSQRMVDLVNSLLNVSRIELGTFAIEPEQVDLKQLIKIVLRELNLEIVEKKIKVSEKYELKLKKYRGDKKLLLIIFQNLLSNAVKYTPAKGKVGIEISQNLTKKKLFIEVSDTGYGIPQSEQANIFSKLYRADNIKQKDASGTGLGLYIVKAIIETAKGKIWFESKENKGTTFFIELPLAGMKAKTGSKPLE